MSRVETRPAKPSQHSVADRFAELSDTVNDYLRRFRAFGIRSNRAVANYLCVDSAELSRLKNARVGDINLERGYDILQKCEELSKRLATFGGPLKTKEVISAGFNIATLPCISEREQSHAISLQQQSDSVLLTIDADTQKNELSMLIGAVMRSTVHPRRNPYGPMSTLYVLKSIYAAPASTPRLMLDALRLTHLGRRACSRQRFNEQLGHEVRRRTLAGILNNGGGIALRLSKELPTRRTRMLRLGAHLHRESIDTFYFAGALRGALTCANDLQDDNWAKELLEILVEREGPDRNRWSKGINADLNDEHEWQYLKSHGFWNLLGSHITSDAQEIHS
jgi:hypothetical protein